MSTTTEAMKALVLHAVGDARFEMIPQPTPQTDEVLVRIGFCGVCGSDIPRTFVKGTYSFPTVCGHEFAGIVSAVGNGVTQWKRGDRVAVFPLLWCGKCSACEAGKYVQCYNYDYLGSRSNGAFAEYVVAPAKNLIRVPDQVTLEEAAMTEPASVALHAVKRGRVTYGDVVAVFGAGPIGLMVAQWARAFGAKEVFIFDLVEQKLQLAKELGFQHAYNSRDIDPVKQVNELTQGMGAHVCIESAGVPPTFLHALGATRRGGTMVMLGNPSADVSIPAALLSQAMRREIDLVGTWNSDYSATGNDDDWRATLNAMSNKQLNLLPLITHRVSLDAAFDALKMMRANKEYFAKVLIQP